MALKYDWSTSTLGALQESITLGRLTDEIERAFTHLEAVAYPAKRDGAVAEVLNCLDPGATKYTWVGLGHNEDAITMGRLTAEIHTAMPELDALSYPIRRDAALTELLACVYPGCTETVSWRDFGALEDSVVSGRMAAEVGAALPGLGGLSYPASRDAALAELLAATFPCTVAEPPPSFPGASQVLWLEADYGVTTRDLAFKSVVV